MHVFCVSFGFFGFLPWKASQTVPLNSLPTIFTAACDIVWPIWRSRWTQCGVQEKNKKKPSPHFQFSTLMNHNQIIHKLPPRFQTNRTAGGGGSLFWLPLPAHLVKKQRVDELARPFISVGQPACLLATGNCIRKNLPGALC